ncbi:senescence-associated protein [Anaeramoeba flamelloides]|uniref:Senescence-associated protein n=1 Tax=Anaeramoeba flamelloides TaxID=1746091 RepID=A0AAV7YLT5_9EUKA|nr:senescence-associated protein [Anaeramoeba flamelloides]
MAIISCAGSSRTDTHYFNGSPLFSHMWIGRADIEESNGGVAMNARPPQASYPSGNFSDTSNFIAFPEYLKDR